MLNIVTKWFQEVSPYDNQSIVIEYLVNDLRYSFVLIILGIGILKYTGFFFLNYILSLLLLITVVYLWRAGKPIGKMQTKFIVIFRNVTLIYIALVFTFMIIMLDQFTPKQILMLILNQTYRIFSYIFLTFISHRIADHKSFSLFPRYSAIILLVSVIFLLGLLVQYLI